MQVRAVISWYRVFFGALTLAAIATQLIDLAGRGKLVPLNFFSYFTILSNLLAVVIFLLGATGMGARPSALFEWCRGAAVIVMSVTGIVFTLLLAGTDVDTAIPWVNDVVHMVFPVVVVADWLIDPPTRSPSYAQGLRWLIPPAAWIAYTMIKGPIANWYPYPFLDPANGGYGTVALYCLAILLLMSLVCVATVWLANVQQGRLLRTSAS